MCPTHVSSAQIKGVLRGVRIWAFVLLSHWSVIPVKHLLTNKTAQECISVGLNCKSEVNLQGHIELCVNLGGFSEICASAVRRACQSEFDSLALPLFV